MVQMPPPPPLFGFKMPTPSAPLDDDDPKNEQLINIPINETDSESSDSTLIVKDNEPIYKWFLIYVGVFVGGGTGICLLVYFFWH